MTVRIFIAAVEAEMRAAIARTPIAAPAIDLLDAGGKRLRARLVWWAANAAGAAALDPEHPMLVRAGSAVELAHLGTLIHDDIVDASDSRRGITTLHRRHGVRVATEAGAALAHLANEFVAMLGDPARRAVRRALLATCRGQLRELAVPFVPVPLRMRLAIMQEKTGAFFELAAHLGAHASGADVGARAAVARYARRFGVAFQIADDVLDLAGDPGELGRANGADLRDGVLTLPVLLATDRDGMLYRALETLRRSRAATAVATCAHAVFAGGGVAAASAVARWWLERAVDSLAPLPRNDAVGELITLARTSVERGLRPGTPHFAASPEPVPATVVVDTPLIEVPNSRAVPSTDLAPELCHILDWFHAGLSAMVAARARDLGVRAARSVFRTALSPSEQWSRQTRIAADTIALAHALADEDALRRDPTRTLVVVDALHCATIALLAQAADSSEHERLAGRARMLHWPPPAVAAARRPDDARHSFTALPT